MGFLKSVFGGRDLVVDPADLNLPETIGTDVPGLSLRKSSGELEVEISIVGESFRAKSVAAVAQAAAGGSFDIYLVAEPTNQYDKKAVAVYAANMHVGYIAKPNNRQWFVWVTEALERGELLWGRGRAATRAGTSNIGIFGSILMPRTGKSVDELTPMLLSDSALQKAIAKVSTLSNSTLEPETLSQLRSISKKALTAAIPVAAHAKSLVDGSDERTEEWAEILEMCDAVFADFEAATYASDVDDVDVVASLVDLSDKLQEIL